MSSEARRTSITVAVVVVALALLMGGGYWFFWFRPYVDLHARASALMTGIHARHVSTADGTRQNESILLYPPTTIATYMVNASPTTVCAELTANLTRQYGSVPRFLRIFGPQQPGWQGTGCAGEGAWGAVDDPTGGISFGVLPASGGARVKVSATLNGASTARDNVLPDL